MILEGEEDFSRHLHYCVRCDIYDIFWIWILFGRFADGVGSWIMGKP